MNRTVAAVLGALPVLLPGSVVAQTGPPTPVPTAHTAAASTSDAAFWFGLRAWALTLDLSSMDYGACSHPGCDPVDVATNGHALGLSRRVFSGFELSGGVYYRFLWARVNLGVGWDLGGKATVRATLGGTPGTVTTTGIAAAVTGSLGVAARLPGFTTGVGPFVTYLLPTATFDPGGDPQGVSGHLLLWGGEAILERRLRRGLSVSVSLRLGVDLSFSGSAGVSFE